MAKQKAGITLPKDRVVLGRKPVWEILEHSINAVEAIYFNPGTRFDEALSENIEKARRRGISVEEQCFSEEKTLYGVLHQGIALLMSPQRIYAAKDLIARAKKEDSSGVLLVLEQLQDPNNFGAILRVAEAVGVDGVFFAKDRSVGVTPSVRKVSAGASELIPLASVTNIARLLVELKKEGFWVIGAALEEESVDLFESSFAFPIVLVLGAEGQGLRALSKKHCDMLVKIPMPGRVQSLNVSQAASVLLYELHRQRTKATAD